mmetsp:Transcript_11270/g.16454  ORF Transcript_11270/g.16454 Transcript_11270/m.16454 type:complete len:127 (-) Transcript_11270:19-399(-)
MSRNDNGTPHKKSKPLATLPTPSESGELLAFDRKRHKFCIRIRKEDVEATDETVASVKKLSQWLSDDPFEKKKIVAIRRGAKIARKSRAFETDDGRKESRIQREQKYFPMDVTEKRKQLEAALQKY